LHCCRYCEFTHHGKDISRSILLDDCTKSALVQTLGYAANRNLKTGAGLATETRGVPLSEGVEELGGCGVGVNILAQLQILLGRESYDLVDIGNDGLEGIADIEQGGMERIELLGVAKACLGKADQILGELLGDVERRGNALALLEIILSDDLELVGISKVGADLALVVARDERFADAGPGEEVVQVGAIVLGEVVAGTEIVQLLLAAGLGEAGAGQLLVDLIVEPRNELLPPGAVRAAAAESILDAPLVVLILGSPDRDYNDRVVGDLVVDLGLGVGRLDYFEISGGGGYNGRGSRGGDRGGGGSSGDGGGGSALLALPTGRPRRSTGRLPPCRRLGGRGGTALPPPTAVGLDWIFRSGRSGPRRLLLLGLVGSGGLGGSRPHETGIGGRALDRLGSLLLGPRLRHGGGIDWFGYFTLPLLTAENEK